MGSLDLINRIAAKKKSIQGTEFVAPPTHDQHIVSVNGLAYKLNPDVFVGQHSLCVWRVFENNSIFIRPANAAEMGRFVKTLPERRGIIFGDLVHVWAWHDCPNPYYTWVPVTDHEYQTFDWVNCGYSGTRFYVQGPPLRAAIPNQMRAALVQETKPEDLKIKGMTPEMLAAYTLIYTATVRTEEERLQDKVSDIMAFTKAKLLNMRIQGDEVILDYEIPSVNRRITSRIEKDTFKVITAGVCLTHEDQNYHLQTLIPVIEYGYQNRLGHWNY